MTRSKFAAGIAALLFAFAIALAPAAQASDLWFHVTVHEGEDNANISVNLPLSLVESALTMIQVDEYQDGKIQLEDTEISAAQLRQMWQELEASPNVDFVTIDSDDESMRVFKEDGYLVVRGEAKTDNGSDIHVRVPSAVVAALLDGVEDNQLNIAAALRALAAQGEGELATITEDDTRVRVWIDQRPEGR